MKIKEYIKKIILGYKYSSKSYINYLKKVGVSVGNDVTIYRPFSTTIDLTSPHLLSIGNNVVITGPTTILTHDYSWSVLKKKYGYIVGNTQKTIIGNNVFIGWGATILGGTTINDNVIIGAGSVVSGNIESDSVYAGNPAKRIMSIEEFYKKRIIKQLDEAVISFIEYKERFNKNPDVEMFSEYFFLFSNSVHNKTFDKQLALTNNYELSNELYSTHKPVFDSYDQFVDYCNKQYKNKGDNKK